MSNTLNRPLFKQGPDGQMRTAAFGGGLRQLYKAGKQFAPKFTNVPYNFNAAMAKIGVPTITGKKTYNRYCQSLHRKNWTNESKWCTKL